MTVPAIHLRPKREARLRAGHRWVFSNEIRDDVSALPPGGVVDVYEAGGRFLGRGYANPRSLIAVRLLTANRKADIDSENFFVARLTDAISYRQALYPDRTALRLVHGEADGLPGLTIDRYGDHLSVQITTLGMESRKDILRGALERVLSPRSAVLRNDARVRELEGLPRERGVWFGEPETPVIDELGVRFQVDLLEGPGHPFDQTENRRFAAGLCRDRDVLDVYAKTGAWSMHALSAGAKSTITLDASESSCAALEANAELNSVSDRVKILCDEPKRGLQQMSVSGMRFDAVVLDPPAFAKSRKTASHALRSYGELNALGMSVLKPGGFLFTSSSSYHIDEGRFVQVIHEAARESGLRLRLVRRGEQAPDHPMDPGVPESRYLKSYAFQVNLDV